MKNKAQLQISFGVLFSIILIIIFLTFGFYVITKFLNMQTEILIGTFKTDLQNEIDKAWKGGSQDIISSQFEYTLPLKINYFCIVDFSSGARGAYSSYYNEIKKYKRTNMNSYFYPEAKTTNAINIEHIDIESITENDNPFCLKNSNEIIKLRLQKVSNNPNIIIIK